MPVPDILLCAPCGREIPPLTGYFAAFRTADGSGVRFEAGCEHYPIEGISEALAVFGSGGCLLTWMVDVWPTQVGCHCAPAGQLAEEPS